MKKKPQPADVDSHMTDAANAVFKRRNCLGELIEAGHGKITIALDKHHRTRKNIDEINLEYHFFKSMNTSLRATPDAATFSFGNLSMDDFMGLQKILRSEHHLKIDDIDLPTRTIHVGKLQHNTELKIMQALHNRLEANI